MKHLILYLITLLLVGIGSGFFVFAIFLTDVLDAFIGLLFYILAYVVDTYNKIDNSNYY